MWIFIFHSLLQVSAYTGGLFVAALDAYQQMIKTLKFTCQLLTEQIELRISELEGNLPQPSDTNGCTGEDGLLYRTAGQ